MEECFMYAKRLKCPKCGRTLCNSVGKSVVSVECSCGEVVYPKEQREDGFKAELRHRKYR